MQIFYKSLLFLVTQGYSYKLYVVVLDFVFYFFYIGFFGLLICKKGSFLDSASPWWSLRLSSWAADDNK